MRLLRIASKTGVCLMLYGCGSPAVNQDVPALITDPTPQSRAELLSIVTDALDGAEVTLADDALTNSSELIIERNRQRDLQDRPFAGRELGRPERFRLVIRGSRCWLVHERDGQHLELQESKCIPQ